MDGLISKREAITALKAIKYGLWEIDIPSPTVPEYVEHHRQIQDMMGVVDNWTAILAKLPPAEPELIKDLIQKFHDYQVEWLTSHCDLELEPELEMWVVRFLHDTADCFMMEVDDE